MIKVENLCKSLTLGEQTLAILSDVNVAVNAGETLAIVGKSGSGKSTLLSLLAGLDKATSGHVYIKGQDLSGMSEDERASIRKQHVGFVFQNFQLLPHLSALDNVMLPLELSGTNVDAKKTATDWLEKVGLAERLEHQPNQLSGGEQQRVAIARAFACSPDILFADEPTGNLDEHTGEMIEDLLFDLNTQLNTTLILVTHDEALAKRCQRQVHLQDGQLLETPAVSFSQ
ncbi:ABC transporter ATP-binding protein [Oceaniserpentilla sp. 4NH20-0058]|uniref:ABC transporter ATP-binding protein n=1 Tax=Oceaniserpentilla sp. 4NH20-0058 TaxID=3127660 RepID=UPI003108C4E8